jgi:hypothetical protein
VGIAKMAKAGTEILAYFFVSVMGSPDKSPFLMCYDNSLL